MRTAIAVCMADVDAPYTEKRQGGIRHVVIGHRLQNVARPWPHQIERGESVGHVADRHAVRQVLRDPSGITNAKRRTGHQIEMPRPIVNQRHIGFDAAFVIAKLGIDRFAGSTRNVIGGNALQSVFGIIAGNFEL